ncbi:MAG: hypothetical protein J5940_03355 [Clostridia bacterium]|nr:hypothetical protein [Clostridia bacterium]
MKIAHSRPFEGTPKLHLPPVFGASAGKELIFRIPVTGKRPISLSVAGLPDGLFFDGAVIRGTVESDSTFTVSVTAENAEGTDRGELVFVVAPDTRLLTPLMGFTTWNAFESRVTQEDAERTAKLLVTTGLADYGYAYVNIDSGWQHEYGGKYDAIMPNFKFPDMKGFCDRTHGLGLKCGIYSTPMLKAWGCPREFESIPGCTRGEPDRLYSCTSPIGVEKLEANNVRQWDEWGFDYLKYDWTPCDPTHADRMRKELLKAKRDFAMCVTVNAREFYWKYWRDNCTSWRCNSDSMDNWDKIKSFLSGVEKWSSAVCRGHYYDLDMMETGAMAWNGGQTRISENESVFAYSMRAFFLSPLQLSCDLGKMSDFEFDLYTNDEVIALNQDGLSAYPERIGESENGTAQVYRRALGNGDAAYAVFNTSDNEIAREIDLGGRKTVRDVWAKENVAVCERYICRVEPHCAALIRVSGAGL